MDFRPLNDTERRQLINSLRGNAEGNQVLMMDRKDTGFTGVAEEVPDDEVYQCHQIGAVSLLIGPIRAGSMDGAPRVTLPALRWTPDV